MAKAMELLQKLALRRNADQPGQSVFDTRLQKLSGVHHVSVARAVLFRTARSHSAA